MSSASIELAKHVLLTFGIVIALGTASAALAQKLKARGYTNVANLEGSIFQWANEGRPVYRGDEQVTQVHPFDAQWGRLLKGELRFPLPESARQP